MDKFQIEYSIDNQNKVLYTFERMGNLISLFSYQKAYRKKSKLTWSIKQYWSINGLGNLLKQPNLKNDVVTSAILNSGLTIVNWQSLKKT